MPTVSADDEKSAIPVPEFGSVTAPIVFVPSRNVTLPVAAVGVTVAVQLTACPNTEGLGAQVRAVAVTVPAMGTEILKSGISRVFWASTEEVFSSLGAEPASVSSGCTGDVDASVRGVVVCAWT